MGREWVMIVLLLTGLAVAAVAQQPEESNPVVEKTADSENGSEPTTVIDELTQAEIDAELAKAEKVLEDPDDVKEFIEDKPLPADLPLAIPSDF